MLSEGLVVHKEIHYITLCSLNPIPELLGCERPFCPIAVTETECDVVTELVVAQEKLL